MHREALNDIIDYYNDILERTDSSKVQALKKEVISALGGDDFSKLASVLTEYPRENRAEVISIYLRPWDKNREAALAKLKQAPSEPPRSVAQIHERPAPIGAAVVSAPPTSRLEQIKNMGESPPRTAAVDAPRSPFKPVQHVEPSKTPENAVQGKIEGATDVVRTPHASRLEEIRRMGDVKPTAADTAPAASVHRSMEQIRREIEERRKAAQKKNPQDISRNNRSTGRDR